MSPDRNTICEPDDLRRSADAYRWQQLRLDTGCFETLTECIEACLPEIRRCAHLFRGAIAAGDQLAEDFLADVLDGPPQGDSWRTPAGLTALFEQFLTGRFRRWRPACATPANSNSGHAFGSAADFMDALAKG